MSHFAAAETVCLTGPVVTAGTAALLLVIVAETGPMTAPLGISGRTRVREADTDGGTGGDVGDVADEGLGGQRLPGGRAQGGRVGRAIVAGVRGSPPCRRPGRGHLLALREVMLTAEAVIVSLSTLTESTWVIRSLVRTISSVALVS